MSSRDIKLQLKEAREAVKCKKFSDAIRLCNKILKEDNSNYMALLLMGACYQDTDKTEAALFLKRALTCSSDPTVALQGLANCATNQELPAIYQQLLSLTPEKYLDLHSKLLKVAENGEQIDLIVHIFENETELKTSCDERINSAYKCLSLMFKDSKLERKYEKLNVKTLEHEIKNKDDPFLNEKFKRYLKILFHMKLYEKLAENASLMHQTFINDITPLEWICHIYAEQYLEKEKLSSLLSKPLKTYLTTAVEMNPSSEIALVAIGIFHFKRGERKEAIEFLRKADSIHPNWAICLNVLAETYFEEKAYGLAENIYRKLKFINVNLFISLIEDGSSDKLQEANVYWTDFLHKEKHPNLPFYSTKLQILLDNIINIDETLEKLKEEGVSESELKYLQALQLKKTKKTAKAVDILEQYDNNFDCLLELSIIYFEIQNMEKSFTCALKAIKLQPSSSICFYHLGKIYLRNNDTTRAQKCLQKCISLNPFNKEAIILLSVLYRNLSDWEANSKLLQNLINLSTGPTSAWAHLQLALHHLGQQQYEEAIAAFRTVIRYDVNNIASWEGLADAYMGRGSYISAMKVFEKTVELSLDNPYPILQLANIKNILKQNKEALVLFGNLLKCNEKYFPAVKGIAESHADLCYSCLNQRIIGKSRDHAQHAVNYFTKAIKMKSNFSCLWKQLGDVLDTVAYFPKHKSQLLVEAALAGVQTEQNLVKLERAKLSELAGRCYCRAVQLCPNDSLLWYEMSSNTYKRGLRFSIDNEDRFNKYLSAIAAVKQAIKLEPSRWQNWNLLGVICATKQVNNLGLAQHCFIEAISLDKKTAAVGWSNLGVLYLLQGSTSLANKAFGRAQQIDTTYINAWIGQAIIAERMGQVDEAIDLFRHCTQLGYHTESSLGYAHWVCSVIQDDNYRKNKRYLFAIDNMCALPVSHDCITWHCAEKNGEASDEALRFLGYISYRLGLWKTAAEAYQKALTKTRGNNKDQVLSDLGYCLLKQKKYREAVECFQRMEEATYEAAIGKALAYFKSSQYEESYSEYESTLNWLANSDLEKSYVLIAMSAMVYAFQGESDAKTILFQCITLPEPPIHALFSACALGLLHNDNVLTELVIKELRKYENDPKHGHHVVYLVSQFYWINMRKSYSLSYLISQVHKFPDRPKLRQILAISILKNHRTPKKNLFLASNIAESALVLDLYDKQRSTQADDAAKWLAVASEAVRPVDVKRRRILAQKAVHVDPSCKQAWSSLIRVLQQKM